MCGTVKADSHQKIVRTSASPSPTRGANMAHKGKARRTAARLQGKASRAMADQRSPGRREASSARGLWTSPK
jgi:hypothetical protein